MKSIALPLVAALSLAGCAKINDAGMRLVASSAPALAMVNNTLLSGEVKLFVDRSGTLNLDTSPGGPLLKCMGTLRYTATQSGIASLKCSDGTDVLMNFNTIQETMGYGRGRTAAGVASFAFGFEPADAAAYLMLPAGKHIVSTPEGGVRLE